MWQLIPFSCRTTSSGSVPDRNARGTRRPIASHWGGEQPPPAPVPVDSHSLASQFVSEEVDFGHILHGGFVREINGLRNRIIRILLKCGLHPDMITRGDIMGRHKELPDPLRHAV